MEAAIPPDTAAAADEGSSLAGSECTGCCCRLWLCSCCPAGVLLCGGLLSTAAAGAGPFVRANRGAAGATEACSAGRSATCSRACSCDSDCRPVRCPLNTCKFASPASAGEASPPKAAAGLGLPPAPVARGSRQGWCTSKAQDGHQPEGLPGARAAE